MEKTPCLIIGNGKSLNDVPMEFLDMLPTFGANRIYLKYSPTYFSVVNPTVARQYKNEILEQVNKSEQSFITAKVKYALDNPKITPLSSFGVPLFSHDPEQYIWEGGTVTYVSMQLAFWMGFRTVYLVGLDHYFEDSGKPHSLLYMDGDDSNHFDPGYFKGRFWNAPDLEMSEKAYKIAKSVFDGHGGKIYNLSTKTALSEDIIERRDLWTTMEQYRQ